MTDRALLAAAAWPLVVARYVPGGRTAVTLGMGALRHPLASTWPSPAAQHHSDSTWTAPLSSLTTEPLAPQRARPTQEQT